jgi:putative molybdopterin biosynthesis protein
VEPENSDFYSPEELAEKLKVNKMTIYRLLARGELPYHQIGKLKRIRREDFEEFLRKTRVETQRE